MGDMTGGRMIFTAMIACVASLLGAQPESARPAPAAKTLTVHVVDESGKGVAGAHVGGNGYRSVTEESGKSWLLGFFGEEDVTDAVTDASGNYAAKESCIFYGAEDSRAKSIIAWNEDHSRVGLALANRSDLGGSIEIKLAPACHVVVKTKSSSLAALGIPLKWANVYVFWGETRPFGCDSQDGTHEFWLPPGEYKLDAYSSDTYWVHIQMKVESGDKEKVFEADLPANRLSQLIGKPAPELAKIKGWKNGGPVKLADLRGKVVILDFWGYWCGPCVHSMPELMELYEQYKDKGVVIIAVHDDSAESIEDMDRKLEKARKEIWGGRDLPFLVALDGGGATPVEGRDQTARGATTAAYGINSFPTQIVIDKEGKVVGRLSGRSKTEMLDKLLSDVH